MMRSQRFSDEQVHAAFDNRLGLAAFQAGTEMKQPLLTLTQHLCKHIFDALPVAVESQRDAFNVFARRVIAAKFGQETSHRLAIRRFTVVGGGDCAAKTRQAP